MPRWLLLLLGGIVIGAGGLLLLQERYWAPRLTADASARLIEAFDRADAERSRLSTELGQTTKLLAVALDDERALAGELAASRAAIDRLQDDLATVIASLPADPRKGTVEVRAARFTATAGLLAYDVVLTREQATDRPLAGSIEFVLTGGPGQDREASVTSKPIALSMGRHEIVRGSMPLPQGFRPHQTTVRVLDRGTGKVLGMRMLMVR